MSINAEVSKKLIISSPDEFYNYISKKASILEKYTEFGIFKDYLYSYIRIL